MSKAETYFRMIFNGMTKEFAIATKDLFYGFINRTDHYVFTRTLQMDNNYDDTWSYIYMTSITNTWGRIEEIDGHSIRT